MSNRFHQSACAFAAFDDHDGVSGVVARNGAMDVGYELQEWIQLIGFGDQDVLPSAGLMPLRRADTSGRDRGKLLRREFRLRIRILPYIYGNICSSPCSSSSIPWLDVRGPGTCGRRYYIRVSPGDRALQAL